MIVLLLVGLPLGCSGPAPASTATDGALAEADCADGVDNDGDGRADCEDGDCSQGCVEADCADGVDDDMDGFEDCADEDCWGLEACVETYALPSGTVVSSRVTGGAAQMTTRWKLNQFDAGEWTKTLKTSFLGESIEGTAMVLLPSATTSTACSWTLESVTWRSTDERASGTMTFDGGAGERSRRWGFDVNEGCPLDSPGFLPSRLQIADWVVLGSGVRWYHGPVVSSFHHYTLETVSFEQYSSIVNIWQVPALSTGSTFVEVVP